MKLRRILMSGFFGEIFRNDWKDLLQEDETVEANLSASYSGMIRTGHRYHLGQVDYFIVLQGELKICAYDVTKQEINKFMSSEEKPQIVRMPGRYWHSFKNVGDERAIDTYFVNRLYDHANPDERRPWNDNTKIDNRSGLRLESSSP